MLSPGSMPGQKRVSTSLLPCADRAAAAARCAQPASAVLLGRRPVSVACDRRSSDDAPPWHRTPAGRKRRDFSAGWEAEAAGLAEALGYIGMAFNDSLRCGCTTSAAAHRHKRIFHANPASVMLFTLCLQPPV
jgi:hypothetical protein